MVSFFRNLIAVCIVFLATCAHSTEDTIWIEAEHFADPGGWTVDTQFVAEMGSAYLLASGAGTPVAPARTSVRVPEAGRWRAWVRTRNWLPEFSPGTFAVEINGKRSETLGNLRKHGWNWQTAGEFDLPTGDAEIRLLDFTGWFGRCDAIVLKRGDGEPMRPKTQFPSEPAESFDVVVVGAGPAGSSAAIAAARAGARTLIVHDRPCVGGNASREIRIAPSGAKSSHPEYHPLGICAELYKRVPDPAGDWTDAFDLLMRDETNLTVVGNMRIVAATTNGIGAITSVQGVDVRNGTPASWLGSCFVDATGDGWLGFYAGAAYEKDALSMSGSLVSAKGRARGHVRGFLRERGDRDQPFVAPPWAYALKTSSPPRLADLDGALLEHPYSMDELADGEGARDELLRMTVSYWNWLKNVSPDREKPDVRQSRVKSYVTTLARREGRRLLGDYVLTEEDELAGRRFPDAVAHGGYPVSTHDVRGSFASIGSSYPRPVPPVYDIPFRSLYSTNVVNLLMAGRCISMTHRALGSARVEATCVETGEAAGRAAAVCARDGISPRTYGRTRLYREIPEFTIAKITSGKCNGSRVRVTGFVSNIVRDETDVGWTYLILKHLSDFVTVRIRTPADMSVNPDALVHSYVRLTGTVRLGQANIRRYIGPYLELAGMRDVEIVQKPPQIPFTVSPLEDFSRRSPVSIVTAGPRVIDGQVLAVWGGRNLMIRSSSNAVHCVELLADETLPDCGSTVQVAGRPTTDTFNINFTRARCRTISPPKSFDDDGAMTSPAQALRDDLGKPHVNMALHGRPVRFTGTVLADPDEANQVLLECDGIRILYDISADPRLAKRLTTGSRVRFSGIGMVETDIWHADATFPLVRGFVIIGRGLDDVTVLETAPWWTTGRLLVVIGALFGLLIAVIIWNRILNRLVEKRGRQLYREEFARSAAVLRTEDRTRLAVELHDSLSQTLTGVAMQVDAVALAAEQDPAHLTRYVATARRTVDNCRSELKNCLWDLRNQALDESDATEAVRKTVSPLAGDAVVTIDFGVPRSHFSDLTFHDVLRVLRELVTNAVRHGHAGNITITSADDGQTVRFTVKDNGIGFDPSKRPGIADGHFGLDGIVERLRRTKGSLSIDSAPGRGTTVTFTLTRNHP